MSNGGKEGRSYDEIYKASFRYLPTWPSRYARRLHTENQASRYVVAIEKVLTSVSTDHIHKEKMACICGRGGGEICSGDFFVAPSFAY